MPRVCDKAPAALEARGLTFCYAPGEKPVFQDLSLTLREGEAVLLMGASGCGKSTLAYCLAGLYPDYAGELAGTVRAGGADVRELGPQERSRRVSVLFQNPDNQFCMDTVGREVLFALENVDWQGELGARVGELLAAVGLEGRESERIDSLSGGTKQKLALCTALACGARALVLDEPFANLDPSACADLSALLGRLKREQGVSLLVVDHRPGWWLPVVDRVALMEGEGSLDARSFSPSQMAGHAEELRARGLFLGDSWARDLRRPAEPLQGGGVAVYARGLAVGHGPRFSSRRPLFGRRRPKGDAVLEGVELMVRRGSVCALVGECGSGKSTLLSALAGCGGYEGELTVAGRVGLVFQNPRLQFLALTVADEVLVTLRARFPREGEDVLARRVEPLLAEFGLAGLGARSPYELSQGQQRRLAMLAMLAGDADVLLLDEPTYAQDERATRMLVDVVLRRVSEGLAVVMATHDLELARAVANQVVLFEGGRARELSGAELDAYVEARREPSCGA